MKIEKFVLPIENQPKKEAIKMVKKCLAVTLAALIVIFNVVPAQAYTVLDVGVTVSASGTLTGSTVAFTATVVNQADGLGSTLVFPGPMSSSGLTNSTKALKISGGTNEVDARIIICTDNDTLFTDPLVDPREKVISGATKYSGSDGSGLVGTTSQGYVVPLVWGVSATPNTFATYSFTGTGATANWNFITDKWHNHTYVPTLADGVTVDPNYAVLDTAAMYRKTSNTPEPNTADEGTGTYKKLYPQLFGDAVSGVDYDLYDLPSTNPARKVYTLTFGTPPKDYVVGQALYKNIATVAYGIQKGTGDNYICQVPKLPAPATGDNFVTANLKKIATAGADQFIYINIGGDFRGVPAQPYGTTKLYVAMVNG